MMPILSLGGPEIIFSVAGSIHSSGGRHQGCVSVSFSLYLKFEYMASGVCQGYLYVVIEPSNILRSSRSLVRMDSLYSLNKSIGYWLYY
jgi:hypothetical protein